MKLRFIFAELIFLMILFGAGEKVDVLLIVMLKFSYFYEHSWI